MKRDEQFHRLRKLLALKRYEKPPPGYFEHFSQHVIARLEREAAEARRPWWERVLPFIELRPLVAFAYGAVVVGSALVAVQLYPTSSGGNPGEASRSIPVKGGAQRPYAESLGSFVAPYSPGSNPSSQSDRNVVTARDLFQTAEVGTRPYPPVAPPPSNPRFRALAPTQSNAFEGEVTGRLPLRVQVAE